MNELDITALQDYLTRKREATLPCGCAWDFDRKDQWRVRIYGPQLCRECGTRIRMYFNVMRHKEGGPVTIKSIASWSWKALLALGAGLVAILTLGAWKRREAEAAGARKARQEREDMIRRQTDEALQHIRKRRAERLAEDIEREAEEAEARRKADEARKAPELTEAVTEDVIKAVRKELGREQ